MTDKIKQSKLDSTLEDSPIAQTRGQSKKLKFTDYAIERYTADFINSKGKNKKQTVIPFDISKNTSLKGLKLAQYQKTKKKVFVLQFWINGKSESVYLGEFRPGIFGVSECESKVFEIVKEHTNDKGHWIKNPKQTILDSKTKISKANIIESQKLSIREVIERICIEGFPKAKKVGNLSAHSIKSLVKYFIGYNWRSRHLIYTENLKGHGKVSFKANTHRRTVKPEDWADLFKKFPPGHGMIKDKRFNPLLEVSLYDSDLGKLVIDELNEGIIRKYVDISKRAFGTKENLLDAISTLWNYSLSNSLFGDVPPKIEFKNIVFKKPEQSNYVGAKYNNLRFSDNEMPIIFNALMERRDQYPFQAEALLFLQFTGRRVPETLKTKPGAINKERGVIILNYGTTKGRKEEFVDITPPIKLVLDSLEYQLKKPEFQKYRFVDWLFPTTRINSQRLHEDSYVRSEATRLKSLRGCWDNVIKETGIIGSPKMFRKTFSSIAKLTLGTSSKARALTGHEQDSTLDVHYDKTSRETAKEYAHQVAEVFNFIKKTG